MNILECNMIIDSINLWDSRVWNLIIQIGIVSLAILISNCLRRKVKFIKNSLVPTTVIAGMLILVLKFIPAFDNLIDNDFMEIVTYHTLGLGFIAMSLKKNTTSKDSNKYVIMDTGLLTVNTYLIQGIVGLGLTLLIAVTFMPDLYYTCGLLLPLGYGQGPGQALNFGKVYESGGFVGGASFGLAIAAVGFLFACIGGVIYMNILKKQGKLTRYDVNDTGSTDEKCKNEIPLTESIDKLTVQVTIICVIYLITYLVMMLLSNLSVEYLDNFGINTVRPLLYGFNFLFGVIFSVCFKKILDILKHKKIVTREYLSNSMLDRISGWMFDLMIVTGICAIKLEDLGTLFIPLAIICSIGGAVTMIYVRFCCNKLYPDYPNEAFFSMFGMLTGTASTGMILLREIDPEFKTPAANNLVFQSLPAICFGFPLLLLIPIADDSMIWAVVVLGIIVLMFIAYNVLMFRKFLFSKKIKSKKN